MGMTVCRLGHILWVRSKSQVLLAFKVINKGVITMGEGGSYQRGQFVTSDIYSHMCFKHGRNKCTILESNLIGKNVGLYLNNIDWKAG